MSAIKDSNPVPPLQVSLLHHVVPEAPIAPYPPSPVEAENYFYGIYSKPRLVARSSIDPWIEPRGAEAYLTPKELSPLGFNHPLQETWESVIGPCMADYLDTKGVKCSSLDPVRIGHADDVSPPAILWVGVLPGSLTARVGVEVAVHLKGILSAHGINDTHVELRESRVFRAAKLYKPVPSSIATVRVVEPFSTTIGIPISAEATPAIGGTGGFFISDPRHPSKIFLVTARHVVIPPDSDNNLLFKYTNISQPRKNVMLFSDPAAEKHLSAIKSEINGKHVLIMQLNRRLTAADEMGPEYAEIERDEVGLELNRARTAIEALEKFLPEATRDWKDRRNRIVGHVVLAPPIGLNVGEDGFTEDWAVIEIDASKVNSTNFVGNVIDLGIDIPINDFTLWMYPNAANPPSFKYPGNRLHRISSTIPDKEMWNLNPKTKDHENDRVIMVMKRGHSSGLTVGRLNTIRSFTRCYFEGEPGTMSKEVTILPRNSKSGPFSRPGDSGSSVVDGKGRLAGLLTGGAGATDISDCTYVTSANFIRSRMLMHGLKANFFPSFSA